MGEASKTSVKVPETKRGNKVSHVHKGNSNQPVSSPVERIFFLQRTAGNQAVKRLVKLRAIQAKLRIGLPGDIYEQEADRVAEQVMRMPDKVVQLKRGDITQSSTAVESRINNLKDGGQPLPDSVSTFFEPRFGTDFSRVRVHSDANASQSARDVNAHAYTMGHDIVFGASRFEPGTKEGRQLIAHELTHVVQQSGSGEHGFGTLQRCYNPAKNDPLYDRFAKVIKATAAYNALSDKTLADGIITDMKKKPDCLYLAGKLKQLFDTPEKAPATISAETKASTVQETAIEQTRIAKPAQAKNLLVEETASADPARTWVKIKGKFGGGTYQVDRTNPKNIVVKAKLFLKTAGTGANVDIENIKKMEDGIEKAASLKGFTVDIDFVTVPDAETFTAVVDPSRWEDAENWSGGNPTGFAHELLHMFAFEVDRYNYIESHSTNQSMTVPNRLIWFAKQLTKPGGFDNALSIMGSGEHPLDDDVCKVAGLDVATCVAARKKSAKP